MGFYVRTFVALATLAMHLAWISVASADAAPAWSLDVDSDAPEIVSYGAIATRLEGELGVPLGAAPLSAPPSRGTIQVVYRHAERRLSVRAVEVDGRVLERTVEVSGEVEPTVREAVLLASNLARDEASELLDALAARARREPPPPPVVAPPPVAPPPSAPPPPPAKDPGDVVVSAAFLYPLATNYGRPEATSHADLSVLYGRVGAMRGAQIGSGLVVASRGVTGAQLATATVALGDVDGASIAGGVAVTTGRARGAQVAVGFGYAGSLTGLQMTSGLSLVRSRAEGAQIGVGANVAGDLVGAQVGGANVAADVRGGQLGLANVARDVKGGQLGLVNVARDVTGAQISLVNIGRNVKGAQLALVNIADDVDGAALGLVSITRRGVHPQVWGSTSSYANAGLKFSAKYLYSILALGYGTPETAFRDGSPEVGLGLGTTLRLPARFDVDLDALYSHVAVKRDDGADGSNHALQVRILPGYVFAEHLRVFAGGGVRVPLLFDRGSLAASPLAIAGVQF